MSTLNQTLRSWDKRKWSLTKKGLDCWTNSPPNTTGYMQRTVCTHTDVRVQRDKLSYKDLGKWMVFKFQNWLWEWVKESGFKGDVFLCGSVYIDCTGMWFNIVFYDLFTLIYFWIIFLDHTLITDLSLF